MGFFSFKCSKSGVSIPAFPYANLPKIASEVVLVLPDNTHIKGVYDGYGHIGKVDIFEILALKVFGERNRELCFHENNFKRIMKKIKIVRKVDFKDDKYNSLSTSSSCESQGFFYDLEDEQFIMDSILESDYFIIGENNEKNG